MDSSVGMQSRPNILIFCTDQQRADSLSCSGASFTHTPGFDAIAARGTRFRRAYCPSATCTPSRASRLTGQDVMRHGIWSVGVNTGDDVTFLSHRLAREGYETRLIGKAHFEAFATETARSRESVDGFRHGYGDWHGPYYGFETAELALGHTTSGMSGHYGAWICKTAGEDKVASLETARQPRRRRSHLS